MISDDVKSRFIDFLRNSKPGDREIQEITDEGAVMELSIKENTDDTYGEQYILHVEIFVPDKENNIGEDSYLKDLGEPWEEVREDIVEINSSALDFKPSVHPHVSLHRFERTPNTAVFLWRNRFNKSKFEDMCIEVTAKFSENEFSRDYTFFVPLAKINEYDKKRKQKKVMIEELIESLEQESPEYLAKILSRNADLEFPEEALE